MARRFRNGAIREPLEELAHPRLQKRSAGTTMVTFWWEGYLFP